MQGGSRGIAAGAGNAGWGAGSASELALSAAFQNSSVSCVPAEGRGVWIPPWKPIQAMPERFGSFPEPGGMERVWI